MSRVSEILTQNDKPALLIGNGINRFNNNTSSWQDLLGDLAQQLNLNLSREEIGEMSNTEFYDILDLARPLEDRSSLQRQFCDLMKSWEPSDHHTTIVNWARRHHVPIITVNFDENLSKSVDVRYHVGKAFTDWYPWSSYFSDNRVVEPRRSFAIWHAHGMVRYSRSIRLGLRHYMAATRRAHQWIYGGEGALRSVAKPDEQGWKGQGTWLDVLFFSPMMVLGFGLNKDESFMRWLFLERARLYKINPTREAKVWFLDIAEDSNLHRRPFFERIGMEYVNVPNYEEIYENVAWCL